MLFLVLSLSVKYKKENIWKKKTIFFEKHVAIVGIMKKIINKICRNGQREVHLEQWEELLKLLLTDFYNNIECVCFYDFLTCMIEFDWRNWSLQTKLKK